MIVRPLLSLTAAVLAVTASAPSSDPSAAPARRALRLMTYNLNYANPDVAATLDAIAAGDADVIVLQEITEAWRGALRQRFGHAYPHQAYRIFRRAAGGNAVLSKLPIAHEESWAPPPGSGAFFPAQRIVLAAPGGPLQVLNVHLRPCVDGGSWIKGFLTTPPLRRKEIEAHWHKLDTGLPTVIAGDFNEDDTGRAIHFLEGHGLTRVATAGPRTWRYEVHERGQPTELLKMDIDHVVIDRHFTAHDARVLDAGTSDHRPVVVTLRRR